jgi:hypothetical protein
MDHTGVTRQQQGRDRDPTYVRTRVSLGAVADLARNGKRTVAVQQRHCPMDGQSIRSAR